MSYRDDPHDIKERKIENLLKERALLSAHPIANQSKIKAINTLLASLQSEVVGEEVCEENIPKKPKTTLREEKPPKKKFFKDNDWREALPILNYVIHLYVAYEVIELINSSNKSLLFQIVMNILVGCLLLQWFFSQLNKKDE